MASSIQVFLVDDHDPVRTGMRRLLEFEPDIDVVGEASNAVDAVHQIQLLSPDVVLMDIRMPGTDGIEATKQLREGQFAGKVVILSAYEQYVSQAIEAGADGYLVKGAKARELVSTIHRVHEGNFVIGASVMSEATGREAALRYFSGQQVLSPQEPKLTLSSGASHIRVSELDFVIAAPVESRKLIKLVQWLKKVGNAEIKQMGGFSGSDVILEVTFEKPVQLLETLSELPDVVEITEEPNPRHVGDMSTLLSKLSRPSTRYRLDFRAD